MRDEAPRSHLTSVSYSIKEFSTPSDAEGFVVVDTAVGPRDELPSPPPKKKQTPGPSRLRLPNFNVMIFFQLKISYSLFAK